MRRTFGQGRKGLGAACALALAAAFAASASLISPASAQDDHQYTGEQIQAGYRLYAGQCQLCHGVNGDGIPGTNLARQQFRFVSTDADIKRMIANGSAGGGMPAFHFSDPETDGLVAFIRAGMDRSGVSFSLGDALRGKAVYDRSGCASCHRLAGEGARTAPDLTDIGVLRRPGQIYTSLTDPIRATMPINRPVVIVLKDGSTIKGRRYDEDTFSVQLIDSAENLRSIAKSQIKSYQVRMDTDMPSYRGRLSEGELGDLLAFLLSRKG